ncbi:uncharacterized protein LOC113211436 [Frankliniella occidentalis]|uniref:Uncharacterized protein LOC113211436 n=1 Tax=Frankliniella occidentalis TaxID=133901 RepID=A0A9C6XR54_FRAOC|nr:uncharacterized protein LOC113211436 [Frankliniella occidentalis]
MRTISLVPQAMASTQYPYTYGQQMGYWYPQTASYPAAAAATNAAAAQMQASQFMQQTGYSASPFGQYGGYQQAGYMGMASLQMPTTWQGLPAQPAMPAAGQMAAAQASAAALQQPAGIMAFPAMQAGYQLSAEEDWLTPSLLV